MANIELPLQVGDTDISSFLSFLSSLAVTLIDQIAERSRNYPAPGHYYQERSSTPKGVVAIHNSNAKSDLEWKLYHAKQLPGELPTY
eukprot:1194183-Rhodomonas_salina.1